MYKIAVCIFIFMRVFSNCKKKTTTKADEPTCNGTKSYASDVKPLVQSYCVNCHSSYSSYAGIKTAGSLVRSSIVNGSMPKNSSLSRTGKMLLFAGWTWECLTIKRSECY